MDSVRAERRNITDINEILGVVLGEDSDADIDLVDKFSWNVYLFGAGSVLQIIKQTIRKRKYRK